MDTRRQSLKLPATDQLCSLGFAVWRSIEDQNHLFQFHPRHSNQGTAEEVSVYNRDLPYADPQQQLPPISSERANQERPQLPSIQYTAFGDNSLSSIDQTSGPPEQRMLSGVQGLQPPTGDLQSRFRTTNKSVVGKPGLPKPAAARPPRAKFTAEENKLLKTLRENYGLTWTQIGDFFPGRTYPQLQNHFAHNIRSQTYVRWTVAKDTRLSMLLREHKDRKWKDISTRMGRGFTPETCQMRSKVVKLEAIN